MAVVAAHYSEFRWALARYGRGVLAEVEAAPEDHVLQADDAAWAKALSERYSVEPPVLRPDEMKMEPSGPTQVDVSKDRRYPGQPASLLVNGQMLATLDLAPQDSKLGRYPLRVGDPLELESPHPRLRADVREAKKPERLRLAKTPPLAIPGSEPPELDQPRLLGRQLQVELREPAAKLSMKPLSILPILEPHHRESRRGESHPPALAEPGVNLSAHRAPIVQPSGRTPNRQ